MATNEEECGGDSLQQCQKRGKQEPSFLKIKSLLIDIQSSITNITKENKALKKEVLDMKASLEFNEMEVKDVKDSLSKAISANSVAPERIRYMANSRLRKNKDMLDNQKHETERLEDALDTLEQYTRRNSLGIHVYGNSGKLVLRPSRCFHQSRRSTQRLH